MILLKKGTASIVVLTINESIDGFDYDSVKVVFKSRQTKEVVTIENLIDESTYPNRYNKYEIDVNTYFAGKADGFWDYTFYLVGITDKEVEVGVMKLESATSKKINDIADSYTPTTNTTFKTYNPA